MVHSYHIWNLFFQIYRQLKVYLYYAEPMVSNDDGVCMCAYNNVVCLYVWLLQAHVARSGCSTEQMVFVGELTSRDKDHVS